MRAMRDWLPVNNASPIQDAGSYVADRQESTCPQEAHQLALFLLFPSFTTA
jgi:hypothetical protein